MGSLPWGTVAFFGLGRGLQLVTVYVIAHTMTKDMAGVAMYLLGYVTFAQAFCTLGLENYGSYIFPRLKKRGRLDMMWPYLSLALIYGVPVSLLLSLGALTFGEVREDPAVWLAIIALTIASSFGAVRRVARFSLIGTNRRSASLWHDTVSFNLVLIAGFGLFAAAGLGHISLVILIASLVSGGLAIAAMGKLFRSPKGLRETLPRFRSARVLTLAAAPSLIGQAAPLLLNRADVLILAPLSNPAEVATYSVAIRLTFLLATALELSSVLYGSRLMDAAQLSAQELRRLTVRVLVQSACVAALLGIPLMLFATEFLRFIFGEQYADGASVLQMLTLGKLLTAPFQPLLVMLVALGYNRDLAVVLMVAAAANIGIDLLLIPHYGAFGAAIGATSALALMAVGYCGILKHRVWGSATAGAKAAPAKRTVPE